MSLVPCVRGDTNRRFGYLLIFVILSCLFFWPGTEIPRFEFLSASWDYWNAVSALLTYYMEGKASP